MVCPQLLLKIKLIKRLDIVIRSGKVIGDNVNIGANDVVTILLIKPCCLLDY